MIFKSNDELQAKCREWQKRLRLQDWEVVAQIVRAHDMTIEDAQGEVVHFVKKKKAVISLRDQIDFPPGVLERDMEIDLVHELLHLYFIPVHTDENDLFIEQAVECLAHSFVMLNQERRNIQKELKAV